MFKINGCLVAPGDYTVSWASQICPWVSKIIMIKNIVKLVDGSPLPPFRVARQLAVLAARISVSEQAGWRLPSTSSIGASPTWWSLVVMARSRVPTCFGRSGPVCWKSWHSKVIRGCCIVWNPCETHLKIVSIHKICSSCLIFKFCAEHDITAVLSVQFQNNLFSDRIVMGKFEILWDLSWKDLFTITWTPDIIP